MVSSVIFWKVVVIFGVIVVGFGVFGVYGFKKWIVDFVKLVSWGIVV